MSEKQSQSEKPKEWAPSVPNGMVPVKSITFRTGLMVDIAGGKSTASGLRASEPSDQQFWRIYFDPRLRHHRVEHYMPGKGERPPTTIRYIPEGWCTWEAAS